MKVTDDLINDTYDAITMMRLSSQILSEGDVDDTMANEISWMLGSCKKRLEPVIDFLEKLQGQQNTNSEVTTVSASTAALRSATAQMRAKASQ